MRALTKSIIPLGIVAVLGAMAPTASASPAKAQPAPLPATARAAALPAPQHDGVAWTQAIAGDTVFVGGRFTNARPAGGGAPQARNNVLAYNLKTGALLGFSHTFNGQVRAIAVSPDEKTVYIGGEFSTIDGKAAYRLAAFSVATGARIQSFKPSVDGRVNAIATSGNTVYVGGAFNRVNKATRPKLASFTTSGVLTAWNPGANSRVFALTVPEPNKVVVGGAFNTLAGVSAVGHGAVDATSGKALTWKANTIVRNGSDRAGITSLTSHDNNVFGTAYDYGGGGNSESTFMANASDGALKMANGCRGDTYSSTVMAGVLYSVGHVHDCSMIGFKPETGDPTRYLYVRAETAGPSPMKRVNVGGIFQKGQPAPEPLHFLPVLTPGVVTGMNQAAWSIVSKDGYISVAGEFRSVNGVRQQGITRFAVKGKSTDKAGPQGVDTVQGSVRSAGANDVVSWRAVWDMDDPELSYRLVSNGKTVWEGKGRSTSWSRPSMQATIPRTAWNGTLQLKITDPSGNAVTSKKFGR